jgi:dihydroorotate dehydrogenase
VFDTYRFLRPLLFALPPEAAHATTLAALQFAHGLRFVAASPSKEPSASVTLMGLRFPNRLGIAAGLDKNGTCIDALGALGVGFIEVGTVTPLPQLGNAKPRLFRLLDDRALINRMGFPNDGIKTVSERLRRRRYPGVCGVNIGKNASTPLADSINDYVLCLTGAYAHADYIAINISSPNTSELRRLQHGELLEKLLSALVESRSKLEVTFGRRVPLLVKLTTDLEHDELSAAAKAAVACGFDGIIATNTTLCREGLRSANAHEEGGLSGAPLFARAAHAVACIREAVGASIPIIGVGGIEKADDAIAMRRAGADLVQIYTGLIYRGPALVGEVLESL